MKRAMGMAMRWLRETPRAQVVGRGLLAVVVLALAVFLVDTGGEWRDAVSERVADGKNPKAQHYMRSGLWWGGVASLALASALLATSGGWMRAGRVRPANLPRVTVAAFWLPLVAAVVLGGVLSAGRLGVSANGDELYNLRRYIMGSYELDERNRPEFDRIGWEETFFENRGADNHVPYSMSARMSLDFWRVVSGSDDRHFDEVWLRLPAWKAAVCGIAAVGVLLWVAGFPGAGLAAAFLLALHPWVLRYATEASGYSLVLFWVPVLCAAGLLALRTGRWLWWLVFAASHFLALYSVAGLLPLVVLFDIGLLAALVWRGRRDPEAPTEQKRRLAVAVAVSFIPLIYLMAPGIPQIARYLVVDRVDQPMGAPWIQDIWGMLSTGTKWLGTGFENPHIVTMERLGETGSRLPWILAVVVAPFLVVAGLLRLLLSRRPGSVALAVALALPAPVFYLAAETYDSFLLDRYLFFALPGVAALMALGLLWPAALLPRDGRARQAATVLLAVVFLALFAIATHPARSTLLASPKENLKAVAEAIHGDDDPINVPAERILRGHVWSSVSHYDPWSRNTVSDTELRDLMQEADEAGIPLYFTFGYRSRAMTEAPVKAAVDIAENPDIFEHVGTYYGLEQDQFTHRVFRYGVRKGAGNR